MNLQQFVKEHQDAFKARGYRVLVGKEVVGITDVHVERNGETRAFMVREEPAQYANPEALTEWLLSEFDRSFGVVAK